MDKIQTKLDEVIMQSLNDIEKLPNGKEREDAIGALQKLANIRIEEKKVDQASIEIQNKEIESDRDWTTKRASLRNQKIDRWVNAGLQVALTVGSLVAYNVWLNRGLRFEETGTITSPMTRNLLSRLLPRK